MDNFNLISPVRGTPGNEAGQTEAVEVGGEGRRLVKQEVFRFKGCLGLGGSESGQGVGAASPAFWLGACVYASRWCWFQN